MGKRDPICADFSELAVDTSISSGVKGVPKKKYMRDISHSGAGTARGDGGKRNLRRPNKCQKRPTIGAKETYHVRTFEMEAQPLRINAARTPKTVGEAPPTLPAHPSPASALPEHLSQR